VVGHLDRSHARMSDISTECVWCVQDLASYSISQRSPSIRLAQTGVVTGDVCGSTLIDQ